MEDQLLAPFRNGCNCAQTVLLAFQEEVGLTGAQIKGIALGFGGGIGRTGQVCGAVSGAVMALGMAAYKAMDDHSDAKELAAKVSQLMMEEFREEHGSLYCSELLDGIDLRSEEGRAQFKTTGLHEAVCEPAVSTAIRSARKLIRIIQNPTQ